MNPYISGFALGLSLIMAIGAQNVYVLEKGLKGEHVFLVCLICAVSDALLIAAGVGGLGWLIEQNPQIKQWTIIGGAAFLFYYGAKSLQMGLKSSDKLVAALQEPQRWTQTVYMTLAFTWLNPHVYIDTVLLLGAAANSYGELKWLFGVGAMTASFFFFFGLGYGARWVRPYFASAKAWKILKIVMAVVMWILGAGLLQKLR